MTEIVQLNPSAACSSVILRDLSTAGMKALVTNLLGSYEYEVWCDVEFEDFSLTDYAIITASTCNIPYNEGLHDLLRKIGFQETPPTYNAKNSTEVIFWMMPVPDFMDSIKRLRDWDVI